MLSPAEYAALFSIIIIVLISLLNVLIEKRKLAVIPVPVKIERRKK
jgi:hypothetical protein